MTGQEIAIALTGVAIGAFGLRFIQWILWGRGGPLEEPSRVGVEQMAEMRRRLMRGGEPDGTIVVRRDLMAALISEGASTCSRSLPTVRSVEFWTTTYTSLAVALAESGPTRGVWKRCPPALTSVTSRSSRRGRPSCSADLESSEQSYMRAGSFPVRCGARRSASRRSDRSTATPRSSSRGQALS